MLHYICDDCEAFAKGLSGESMLPTNMNVASSAKKNILTSQWARFWRSCVQGVPSKLLQQLHRFQLFTLPQMAIPKQFPLVGGLSGCQLEVHGVSAKRDCLSTKKKMNGVFFKNTWT